MQEAIPKSWRGQPPNLVQFRAKCYCKDYFAKPADLLLAAQKAESEVCDSKVTNLTSTVKVKEAQIESESSSELEAFRQELAFWHIGRMLKSLCNHELFVIVFIIICDQFSYTHNIFLAKTRLIHSDDDDTYKIPGFEVSHRNDQLWNQTTRPPHGLIISYVRVTFWILGHETQTYQNYESIFLCVQYSYLPIPVQLISTFNPSVHMCTLQRSLMN